MLRRLLTALSSLLGGIFALAPHAARAVDLPPDTAEAMFHSYNGGGVTANGPALLVRKNIADKVSLGASYYVDSVSNASIDVVTTASPYRETRTEYGLSADYVYRDSKITLATSSSSEPDYKANSVSLDVAQEVFGGMSTVSLGFTRGSDTVGKHDSPEFSDYAKHWQYRLGVTQILTTRWVASGNFEILSDDGFLGSPYRVARVFGAAVPERNPRTRSARAVKFRVIGDLGSRDSIQAGYRYFWDTWQIKAHTLDLQYSRYFGDAWLADATLRYYKQQHALFYSDNATTETTYVSRNRQLSSFNSIGLGARVAYTLKKVPGQYDIKLNGAYEYVRFKFDDFTDIRTGSLYAYNAGVLQFYVSANF
ncbi:MAG TPA: DUF3570 domain-containing protein [Burkholderiaceae bacterium]|nr:DUF3570 domain-containing protein [Burkholderiaceae bacterium]